MQALQKLFRQHEAPQLSLAIQPWSYQYRRLVMDPSRAVRAESCAAMGAIAVSLGKGLLPHLKGLMGPWWVCDFDLYAEVAAAANGALKETFPGAKLRDALMYCRWEGDGVKGTQHLIDFACS